MNGEKLERVSGAVWRELNLQLLKAGCEGLCSYAVVIVNLLDSAFSMTAKGDKKEIIRLYEKKVEFLNLYIDFQKGNYEF